MTVQDESESSEQISPEVVAFLMRREYPVWERRIKAIRACEQPIRLVGRTVVTDRRTGEIVEVFDSDDQPFGRLLVPCGNRRASRCAPCSRLYQEDTYQLIKAGLVGGKGVPAAVAEYPKAFLTLTSPSFGPVHARVLDDGQLRQCRPRTRHGRGACPHGVPWACLLRHGEGELVLGTPLCLACFRYREAVTWNAHAPLLWARYIDNVRRVTLPYACGLTPAQMRGAVRVSFAKVAEYQRRGLIHFHVVVRLDGPDGPEGPPPPYAGIDQLIEALTLARDITHVELRVSAHVSELVFGEQIDVHPIVLDETRAGLDASAAAAYIAKYATKNAEAIGTVDRSLTCRLCHGSGLMGCCPRCGGTGLRTPLEELKITEHARGLIAAAWELGALPDYERFHLRRWAHQAGFGGHYSTRSRLYSTTMGALRQVRAQFAAEYARGGIGPGELYEVEREWQYAGHGLNAVEAQVASGVRDWIAENRVIGRDELARLRAEEKLMREMAEADPAYWDGLEHHDDDGRGDFDEP